MAFDESLAERIRELLAGTKTIQEKKMFGGIGYLMDGNMLVAVWKDSLIARIGPEVYEDALQEPHVQKFDITGRAMKGWVLIEPEGIDEDLSLRVWIQRARDYVDTLPGKKQTGSVAIE